MFIIKYTYSLVHLLSLLSWSSSWQNSINEDMSKKIMTPSKERRSCKATACSKLAMCTTSATYCWCGGPPWRHGSFHAEVGFLSRDTWGFRAFQRVFICFSIFSIFFKCLFIKIMLFESEIEGFQLERLRSEPGKLFFSARNMFKATLRLWGWLTFLKGFLETDRRGSVLCMFIQLWIFTPHLFFCLQIVKWPFRIV